jgi:hypothetical protein
MMPPLHFLFAGLFASLTAIEAQTPPVSLDLAGYKRGSGVAIRQKGTLLHVAWPIARGEHGVLVLQLQRNEPLLEMLGIARTAGEPAIALVRHVNPVTLVTVGTRDLSKEGWN